MFNQLKLRTKIVLLVVVSLVGMLGLATFAVLEMKRDLSDARRIQIKSVTEALFNTVADFHAQEVAGKLTRDQAQKAALEAVRTARYGGQDGKTEYFYAYTMGGVKYLSHPGRIDWPRPARKNQGWSGALPDQGFAGRLTKPARRFR